MNDPIRQSIDLFEQHGADFNAALAHCIMVGEVQSNCDYFCMGYPQGDTFFVVMLAGDFAKCAEFNASRYRKISYRREFKGSQRIRSIDTRKLASHGKRINTSAASL